MSLNIEEELGYVISDYLCPECKGLLYVGLETKEEICVNSVCSRFPKGTIFGNVKESEKLKTETKIKETQLHAKLMKLHGPSLALKLAQQRNELITGLFHGKGLDIVNFFVLNHILIDMNSFLPAGNIVDISHQNELISEYAKFVGILNMIDDLANKRYFIRLSDKEVFRMKYWGALFSAYQNMGITKSSLSREDLFRYYDINKRAKTPIPFEFGSELTKYFVQYFDFITALRYALFLHYRTSQQFNHTVSTPNVAAILGLFFSVKDENPIWPLASIMTHLNKYKEAGLDPLTFLEEYSNSESKAPILIRIHDGFICFRDTLLLFSFHLLGLNDSNVNRREYSSIAQKKEQAAEIFENHVRQLIRNNGYFGPDKPFKISKRSPEYDIIAINEEAQKIVLVEAKYWEFAPSSFSGEKLVEQELLKKDRLLDRAIEQQNRLAYFKKNFDKFKEKLDIRKLIDDYEILIYVVTKHIPLINRYKEVSISSLDKFKQSIEN